MSGVVSGTGQLVNEAKLAEQSIVQSLEQGLHTLEGTLLPGSQLLPALADENSTEEGFSEESLPETETNLGDGELNSACENDSDDTAGIVVPVTVRTDATSTEPALTSTPLPSPISTPASAPERSPFFRGLKVAAMACLLLLVAVGVIFGILLPKNTPGHGTSGKPNAGQQNQLNELQRQQAALGAKTDQLTVNVKTINDKLSTLQADTAGLSNLLLNGAAVESTTSNQQSTASSSSGSSTVVLPGSGNTSSAGPIDATTLQGHGPSYFTDVSNLSSGTIGGSRLPGDVALLDANNNFSATNTFAAQTLFQNRVGIGTASPQYSLDVSGTINSATALRVGGVLICDVTGCITSGGSTGYIRNGTTPQTADFNVTGNGVIGGALAVSGSVAASTFTGDGSALTNVNAVTLQGNNAAFYQNASNLNAGTISDGLLSSNVPLKNATNTFTANQTVIGNLTATTLTQGTNNVCDISNNCSYASASGSGNYIQNGTAPQTANFNITGNGTVSGNLAVGGTALFKNATNSTSAFQIQSAASGSALFSADTINGQLTVTNVLPLVGGTLASTAVTTVDAAGDVGYDPSMAIAPDGFARITYRDQTNLDLKYAQCTNADCTTSIITVVDSTGNVGGQPTLAIAPDGFARISYYDAGNQDLKYAQCLDAACATSNITTVDNSSGSGWQSYLAIAPDGFARISYYNVVSGNLKYAQCTNAACTTSNITTIDNTIGGPPTSSSYDSLAIAPDGFARISYFDVINSDLKYAQCTNAACTTSNITNPDSLVNVGGYNSLAIAPDGFARISYRDTTNATLKYLQCTNAACTTATTTTVDNTDNTGTFTSIAIAPDGFARISYFDNTKNALRYVQCTNASCSTRSFATVDSTGSTGLYSSIAIGPDGFPRIAYREQTIGSLKYARLVANNGGTVGVGTAIGSSSAPFGQINSAAAKIGNLQVTGPAALQNTVDSTAALQVRNAAGASLLTVDTVNSAIIVGGGIYYGTTSSPINIELTRTIPANVNDYVEIGNFADVLGAHDFRISISAPNSGFSVAKSYTVSVGYTGTGGVWKIVAPSNDSGIFGNDYSLDMFDTTSVAFLRLRRTFGTTPGTATIRVESVGGTTDTFTPTSLTGTASPVPTSFYTSLTQYGGGNVGIGTLTSPTQALVLGSGNSEAFEMAAPAAPTLSCNASGGSLADGTYAYRLGASDGTTGTVVPGTESSCTITGGGGAGSVGLSWAAVTGAQSYKVYGRTASGELLMSTVNAPAITFTDDGSITPVGALPTSTSAYTIRLNAVSSSYFLGGNLGVGTSVPTAKLSVVGSKPADLTTP